MSEAPQEGTQEQEEVDPKDTPPQFPGDEGEAPDQPELTDEQAELAEKRDQEYEDSKKDS